MWSFGGLKWVLPTCQLNEKVKKGGAERGRVQLKETHNAGVHCQSHARVGAAVDFERKSTY